MKVVMMAGGEGTRLRPLTINTPKPLIPICNRPVIELMIEKLREYGLTDIIITLHYLADDIAGYFGDGRDLGVSITYSVEDEPLGTAGSIKKIQHLLDDTFLVISGDALADVDFSHLIDFHRRKQSQATIALYRVSDPLEFGITITDEESKVVRFIEKPKWSEVFSDTVNTGIYCLEPSVMELMEKGRIYDFSNDIFPELMKGSGCIYGCTLDGYWCDIGNLDQYVQATYHMLNQMIPPAGATFVRNGHKNFIVGENTEINASAEITGPAVIGKNTRIGANVQIREFTTIGDNCIIEEDCIIQRSIIWSNTYIGRQSRIIGSILCRGVTTKEKVVTNEGAIVGDKCFIGQNAHINNSVKIWPDKKIEAGATVSMSLIWGGRWMGNLFGKDGISGIANVEITPEYAMKLGASYGASLEKGAIVSASRDSHPASRMLNRAIICGLTSSGIETWDFRIMPTPVARYAIKGTNLVTGGIHVRTHPSEPNSILLEFLNKDGINISKHRERQIESIFSREDFRRAPFDEVGKIHFPTRLVESYVDGFIKALDVDRIRKEHFKIVIDYGYNTSTTVLPMILGQLGCETIAVNAYLDADRESEMRLNNTKPTGQLSKMVTILGANMGVLIDSDGEALYVIDENGQLLPDNLLLATIAYLVFLANPGARIAVPVSAPSVLEKLAWEQGGEIVYSKVDSSSIMTCASKDSNIILAGNARGGFIFPRFHSCFDAMFTLAKLLELLAATKMTLADAIREIPPFHHLAAEVECSFTNKGKLMRRFAQQYSIQPIDTTDGLKIFFKNSWIMISPDISKPLIRLHAEAPSKEDAEMLVERIKLSLESFQKEELQTESDTTSSLKRRLKSDDADSIGNKKRPFAKDNFYFWVPGKYMGVHTGTLEKFIRCIREIEIESIEYHFRRGDFFRWLEEKLQLPHMADRLRNLDRYRGEELRMKILDILTKRL